MLAGAGNLAVLDAHAAAVGERHEATAVGQGPPATIDDEARQRHVVGALGGKAGRTAGEDQFRLAAHTQDLAIGGQADLADPVAAGGKPERQARGGGGLDRALEVARLVLGRIRLQPERGAVERRRARRRGQGKQGRAKKKGTPIERHAGTPNRSEHVGPLAKAVPAGRVPKWDEGDWRVANGE